MLICTDEGRSTAVMQSNFEPAQPPVPQVTFQTDFTNNNTLFKSRGWPRFLLPEKGGTTKTIRHNRPAAPVLPEAVKQPEILKPELEALNPQVGILQTKCLKS